MSEASIVKPLPADEFRVYGSNAEMRWEVMREHGYLFDGIVRHPVTVTP